MRKLLGVAVFSLAGALVPTGALAAAAGQGVVQAVVHHPMVKVLHDSQTSTNWSGYAVQGASQFTEVSGSWVQPAATSCGSGATYSSFWVGIDGYSSDSVEQLGTDTDCSGGKASYYGWYEMYPANSVSLSKGTYPVKAGDTLTASVTRTGTSYTLAMSSSEGWKFSITKTGSDANSSAEWIAESPEICSLSCRLASLTDFGTVNFTASAAADGGSLEPISSFTTDSGPHEITMDTSAGVVRAQPSTLGTSGETFSITWKHK